MVLTSASKSGSDSSVIIAVQPTHAEAMLWLELNCRTLSATRYSDMTVAVERFVVEQEEIRAQATSRFEPRRWLTHGKPGVGKSKLIY